MLADPFAASTTAVAAAGVGDSPTRKGCVRQVVAKPSAAAPMTAPTTTTGESRPQLVNSRLNSGEIKGSSWLHLVVDVNDWISAVAKWMGKVWGSWHQD